VGSQVEIVGFDWLQARTEAWDRLTADAATPNPFYARRIVTAHVTHGLAHRDIRFIVVHDGESLQAMLPFRPRGAWLGFRRRAPAGWTSPYAVESTPLIARNGFADHVEALLDGFQAAGPLWLLPLLALDSSAGAALQAGIAARGWARHVVSPFGRAVLNDRHKDTSDRYAGAKRLRDLRRQRRRLAELGHVHVQTFIAGDALRQAVEDFLALEARGWKGSAGTALAHHSDTAAFLRALFSEQGGPVTCRADVLRLEDRSIAITLSFVCAGIAYLFKTAYEEALARHAPGVLLKQDIIRIWQETGFAEGLNSVGVPGNVLEIFFRDRQPIGDLLFATNPDVSPGALVSLANQEALRRRAVAALKRSYRRMRAACQPTSAKGFESVEAK
jgi:CelD/BcsL family acetyltransferase involved in cellulose biosynthesis